MKKLFIPVLFVLIACLFQSCEALYMIWGQNAKVALATGASGIGGPKSSPSLKDPIGVQVGIETKFVEIDENSSINTGLNFTNQGAGYDDPEYSGRIRLGYLNVPITYTYNCSQGFYGEIGLQPGVLINARDKGEGDGYSYKENYGDYVRKFELGLPIGAGYQVNEKVSVGVRGIWGLTNNNNGSDGYKDHNYMILGVVRYNIGDLLENK